MLTRSLDVPGTANDETTTFAYDGENRPANVTVSKNGSVTLYFFSLYDGDGNRVAQIKDTGSGPVLTAFFMGGAYEVTGSSVKKYYSLGVSVFDDGLGLKYMLSDHQGSTIGVLDAGGTLISQQRYLPFGKVRRDVAGVTQTDFTYTGQRMMDDIDLMDYHARFYDPTIGRFTQPDSIIPSIWVPQTLNRFSYVGNNPTNFTDPSGHDALSTCAGNAYCMAYVTENPIYIDTYIYSDDFDKELGLTFTQDDGVEWTLSEKVKIRRDARFVAASMGGVSPDLSDADAFKSAYPDGIEYHKSNQTCAEAHPGHPDWTCWGQTVGTTITVYKNARPDLTVAYSHFIVHEMGHAFDNATGGALTNGYATRVSNWTNGDQNGVFWTPMPTGNDGYGCFVSIASNRLCSWIQGYHLAAVTGRDIEQTADMFLGWVYGGWGNNLDNTRRKNWMGLWMPYLVKHQSPSYLKQFGCDEDTGGGC